MNRLRVWTMLAMWAMVAVLVSGAPAAADLIPLATGNPLMEHFDLCNPDNSNIYAGALGAGLGALYPFTDNLTSASPRLYELELIAVGIAADVVEFDFPAVMTPMAVRAFKSDGAGGKPIFTYNYAAWTETDKPTEFGGSSYGVENHSVFNIYYSLAVTETYSNTPTTLEAPDALPGWFDMNMIMQNAVPPQFGAGQIRQVGLQSVDLGEGHWTLIVYLPEPATLSLLALGGLALVSRRRREAPYR